MPPLLELAITAGEFHALYPWLAFICPPLTLMLRMVLQNSSELRQILKEMKDANRNSRSHVK